MKKVYFISGLGVDERVFKFIDIPGYQKIYIKWIKPFANEALQHYAERLAEQIHEKEEVVLIGLSFGGIIAQQISHSTDCKKVIIISSIKHHKEMDWKLMLIKHLKLYKIVPPPLLKWIAKFTANYFFSIQTREESTLLHQIIKDTDNTFLKWAISSIMNWKSDAHTKNIVHIHGTKDRIFPFSKIANAVEVKGGGHFMVVSKAKEISKMIGSYLSSSEN